MFQHVFFRHDVHLSACLSCKYPGFVFVFSLMRGLQIEPEIAQPPPPTSNVSNNFF